VGQNFSTVRTGCASENRAQRQAEQSNQRPVQSTADQGAQYTGLSKGRGWRMTRDQRLTDEERDKPDDLGDDEH
jgi:hypothetical protein